jgi:hypothetical protein
MKRSAALFPIVLALGAITFVPWVGTQARDSREEAGPIEIEKCQTISQPGSYKLVQNLTFTSSSGTCLTITANFVTLDLAGFTINKPNGQGPGNPTMAIAAGADTNGITVRNGSISGFGAGVDLGGSNSVVEEVRVGFPCPCEVGISATGIVRSNTVDISSAPSGSRGIAATGIVSGNYVFMTRSIGMEIGLGSTVIGNNVTSTGPFPGIGLQVGCPSNVTNNTAVNNVGQNLVLNGNGCTNTNNVAP